MTPQEILAKWAPIANVFTAIAVDVKALTNAIGNTLTLAQIDARIDAKQAEFVGLAPAAYNTFQKLAAEMAEDDTELAALTETIGSKAEASTVATLDGRVTDLESVQNGMPDFLAAYDAAKV